LQNIEKLQFLDNLFVFNNLRYATPLLITFFALILTLGLANDKIFLIGKNNEILIFPNPTNNSLTLNCKTKISNASIAFYDISGQLVSHQTLDILNTTLDITPYPKGVYTIQILSNSLNRYYKIIKN
jgi:hypothetical protein